jgi:hypothetical protein
LNLKSKETGNAEKPGTDMKNYLDKNYNLKKWPQFIDELPTWSALLV